MRPFTFTILLFSAFIQAQSLNFGFGFHYLTFNDNNVKNSPLFRPLIGLSYKPKALTEDIYIRVENNLSWKGTRFRYDETFLNANQSKNTVNSDYKIRLTTLEMPVFIGLRASEKFSVEAGPYVALIFSAKRKGTTNTTFTPAGANPTQEKREYNENANYFSKTDFPDGQTSKRPLKFYDYGLKVNVKYHLNSTFSFYGRLGVGLNDLFRNNYPFENAGVVSERQISFEFGTSLKLAK